MIYEIISTGSQGNAVVVEKKILIDCGVPWKALRPISKEIDLVLLTHIHGDHFVPATVRVLSYERPALRWGCCEWMVGPLLAAGVSPRLIDPLVPGAAYNYHLSIGDALIRPVRLIHNVPNCGYHLAITGQKAFYATDTGTLDGISAPGYDLYMIEANHTVADIARRAEEKRSAGKFSYEFKAALNHLSQEQAEAWLAQNAGPQSRFVFLHQHHERAVIDDAVV